MSNKELIHKFYTSFSNLNSDGMSRCYSDDIIFTDPAFGSLHGEEAKDMWRMLIQNSKGNLHIIFSDVKADEKTGSAKWIARYTFGKTGRPVVNHIHASFNFSGGKIIQHTDHFDIWKWSHQ